MIFDMTNSLSHEIFKDLEPPELHKEGYEKLVACYKNSLERMQVIYKQDVIKSEPQNAQGRHALEICRTRHKDYADKKRFEREMRQNQAISQPEVCAMPNCSLNSCLICLCYFSYKLIIRRPKNEEKYFYTKNKY